MSKAQCHQYLKIFYNVAPWSAAFVIMSKNIFGKLKLIQKSFIYFFTIQNVSLKYFE